MSGALGAMFVAGGSLATITITIGDDGTSSYGYDLSNFGSLSSTTFNDRSGNSRTILTIGYNTDTGSLVFILSGAVSNADSVFTAISINGTRLFRSDASYYSPSNSIWTWTPGSNIIGTSGTVALIIE